MRGVFKTLGEYIQLVLAGVFQEKFLHNSVHKRSEMRKLLMIDILDDKRAGRAREVYVNHRAGPHKNGARGVVEINPAHIFEGGVFGGYQFFAFG